MKKKLVSIIVPVYNVQNLVSTCIDSILMQTYQYFECIIIDDGSTDESGTICDEYSKKDNRIKVIHQKNAGLSVARNNALKIAVGEYISFIDSDDYVMPNFLDHMIKILEDNNCDIVKCDYHKGMIEDKIAEFKCEIFSGNDFTELVLIDAIGSQLWQYIFKSELWNGIISPQGRYAQDMMILHKVTHKAKKVVVTNEKLYFYFINRKDSTSNSSHKKVKGAFDRAIAFKERYEFALKNNYPRCKEILMIKVLNFFNNAITLRRNNNTEYDMDIAILREFLRHNYNEVNIKTIGIKHFFLGICLLCFPKVYSRLKEYL